MIDDWLFIARDQGVDGVIYALQPGCLPVLNLRKLFLEAFEEAGIPTLALEIRGIFREGYNPQDIKSKLSNFIEVCSSQKLVKA